LIDGSHPCSPPAAAGRPFAPAPGRCGAAPAAPARRLRQAGVGGLGQQRDGRGSHGAKAALGGASATQAVVWWLFLRKSKAAWQVPVRATIRSCSFAWRDLTLHCAAARLRPMPAALPCPRPALALPAADRSVRQRQDHPGRCAGRTQRCRDGSAPMWCARISLAMARCKGPEPGGTGGVDRLVALHAACHFPAVEPDPIAPCSLGICGGVASMVATHPPVMRRCLCKCPPLALFAAEAGAARFLGRLNASPKPCKGRACSASGSSWSATPRWTPSPAVR
jgi:hypothetical protein